MQCTQITVDGGSQEATVYENITAPCINILLKSPQTPKSSVVGRIIQISKCLYGWASVFLGRMHLHVDCPK